jgi:hypothetical protein
MRVIPCVVLAALLAGGVVACDRDLTAQKARPLSKGSAPPAAPDPTAPSPVDTSTPDRNPPKRA